MCLQILLDENSLYGEARETGSSVFCKNASIKWTHLSSPGDMTCSLAFSRLWPFENIALVLCSRQSSLWASVKQPAVCSFDCLPLCFPCNTR